MITDPRIGTELGGYRIESLIGRGGMSVVYLAEHLKLKRKVALKLIASELSADPKFRERFLRETELAASLEHPNIVPIHDAGEAEGVLYLAMRYIAGTDLKALIGGEGFLEPRRAVAIVTGVAAALDAAHDRGLVHRDVKSANVLLAEPGTSREHPYLSDFGLTKRMSSDSGLTATGQFVGTLDYAAPEQFEGKPLDARTDVYSLGCVVYECLTGEVPFKADSEAGLVYAHLLKPPPKPTEKRPDLPRPIDAVISKALAKKPEGRHRSAGDLADAARGAFGVGETAPAGRTPPPVGPRRRRLLAGAALAAAVVAIVAVALAFSRGGKPGTAGGPSTGSAAAPIANRLERIDPGSGRVLRSIPVGRSPSAVTVGAGSVWVANSDAGTVSRIDPVTNRVAATIPVGHAPSDIAFDGTNIWVANPLGNSVSEIDPGSNMVAATVPVDGNPATLAVNGTNVFAGAQAQVGNVSVPESSVYRIDPDSRQTTQLAGAPGYGCPPSVGGATDAFWAGGNFGNVVKRDSATGREIGQVSLKRPVAGITVDDEGAWVATSGSPSVVTLLDPKSLRILAEVPVGSSVASQPRCGEVSPISMAEGGGYLWVTNSSDGTLSKIATVSRQVVGTIDVGKVPTGVAVAFGSLWVTVAGS